MRPEVRAQPRPDWTPVARPGCVGVEAKVLLAGDDAVLVLLRFATGATIDEHAAGHAIDVVCLDGVGATSLGGETTPLRAGELVRWPPDIPHRLWTDGSTMTTLMVEHVAGASRGK